MSRIQWTALVPYCLSLAALATFAVALIVLHPAREPDEGTGAHLWQLLMAAQLPIAAFFAVTWLPRAPRLALWLLALQGVAIYANLVVVRWLSL
jgi:hypothetical protein